MNVEKIRKEFPILNRKVHDKNLVYLDNAATTQKPIQVLNAIRSYYKRNNANIHRSIHQLGEEATQLYENSREKTKELVHASSHKEIVFTKNATESLNIAASGVCSTLHKSDEVLLTMMEHHSNIVPWQFHQQRGIKLKYVPLKNDGTLDMDAFQDLLTHRTKVVSLTHASNVLGTVNDVKAVTEIAHDKGAVVAVDGCQSIPYRKVDIKKLDADLFAFSSHKMLGPTGVGVLYGKEELLEKMPPFTGGGDMIREVHLDKSTWNELPYKFEAGTPNIAGVVGFGAAVDYLMAVGIDNVSSHVQSLVKHTLDLLSEHKDVTVYGPTDSKMRDGAISFSLAGIHPHDIATILDQQGIAIRSGHHCAQPLMKDLRVSALSRASFYLYNTKAEADQFVESLDKVREVFS